MTQETYPMPADGWVCFHCGERFTTPGGAEDHFGARPTDMAACLIKVGEERGLVMALRKAEAEIAKLKTEKDIPGVRLEVLRLAVWMEMKHRENDHKPGWHQGDDPEWFIGRASDELQELQSAVWRLRLDDKGPEAYHDVWKEAADVANFVMMVADVAETAH